MVTLISDTETISQLEWRLKRLENFLGNPDKENIIEKINNLNNKLNQYASNNVNANTLFTHAETIARLTSSDFQRYLLRDRLAKLELILADGERIRHITNILKDIDALARVLDGEYFQEIPKLYSRLDKLLTVHNTIRNQYSEFSQELASFLQNYAAFTLMMDENLQQYKTILHKNQQDFSTIEDNPVE